MGRHASCAVILPLLSTLAAGAGPSARASQRPSVVELFTSQGCSSCPPADALLGELARRPDVLALAFHVGYWDGLGWADRFALPEADRRQSRYARALGLSGVFTPQVILDGQYSFVGSDRGRILPAIGAREGVTVRIERRAEELRIDLAQGAAESADVLLLALLPTAQTPIPHGENGGRTLQEFNIVRASILLGQWDGAPLQLDFPSGKLPPDAAAVAVLLQQRGQGAILGAASLPLR